MDRNEWKALAVRENLHAIGALAWVIDACRVAGVEVDDVLIGGPGRRADSIEERKVARVRHMVIRVVRDTFGLSHPETGRLFAIDHTVSIYHERARKLDVFKRATALGWGEPLAGTLAA